MKPTFLGIGPGKSGTTWSYHILREHPQICMATTKETMFFDHYYHKGFEWYESLFVNCNDALAIGEISNTYIFSAEAGRKIADYNKSIKLITILRNPVDRAFSHYLFLLRNGEENGSFEEVLKRRPDLIQRGEYFRLLSEYLKYFNKSQFGFFVFDDLKNDQAAFRKSLYKFVEVDQSFVPEDNSVRRLPASAPRSKTLAKIVKFLSRWVREKGYPNIVHQVKESKLASMLYKQYESYPKMSDETRKRLECYYSQDVENLSLLLERDVQNEWFIYI